MNAEFSYENLQTKSLPIVKEDVIALSFADSDFIGLYQKPPEDSHAALGHRVGWVVYVSLKEDNENMEKGWNLLKDIFIEHRLTYVKLPKREYKLTKPEEKGRQIAIYQYLNPRLDVRSIFQQIGVTLIQARIEPGDEPLNLKRMGNSQHLFYHVNEQEVIARRQVLEDLDPTLAETENFFSDYCRKSEKGLPSSADLQRALNLLQAHQLFYEIERRLPMKFSFKASQTEEGQRIEFDGNVILAMKITDCALQTL